MKKRDIETRCDRDTRGQHIPCINVKVHRMGIYEDGIAEHFCCDEKTAERALQFQHESAREQFWEDAAEWARDIFGSAARVYSAGRCGGWLIVDGLPDIESWDAIMCSKWGRLVKWCKAEIEYLTGRERILEDIEANEWAKPGAEAYNFVETPQGTKCIADLKQEAIAAGFGQVVRS